MIGTITIVEYEDKIMSIHLRITTYSGTCEIPFPYRDWKFSREDKCRDLILVKELEPNCGIGVTISIRQDGSVQLWSVETNAQCNHYFHVKIAHSHALTQAQEKTLAAIFIGQTEAAGIESTCPHEVLCGLGASPQELMSRPPSELVREMGSPQPALA